MTKTILVQVADDRQGRKNGLYSKTAADVKAIMNLLFPELGVHNHSYNDLYKEFAGRKTNHLSNIDAGINGRWYKPYLINKELNDLQDGDYLIYNDCSPEIWATSIDHVEDFSLDVIRELTRLNNDILNPFVKWDCKNISEDDLGIHIHKYFTTDLCMDTMGLRRFENNYLTSNGMICIRKMPETVKFVEDWLHYNLIPQCASLGVNGTEFWDKEQEYKVGHRHDGSIFGLLINRDNRKCVDLIHNEMNPHCFLQFCRKSQDYEFIAANTPPDRKTLDLTKVFIRRGSKVVNEQDIELTVWRVDFVDNVERIIVGQYEESAWATTRDKIRLV